MWTSVDVQRSVDGTGLTVADMSPDVQFCGDECRWTAKACGKLIDEYEGDIAELIASGDVDRDGAVHKVCHKWAKACAAKPLPDGFEFQIDDAPFAALSAEGVEKVARLKNLKKNQAKQDMGLGDQIDRLEADLKSGAFTLEAKEEL